MTVVYEALSEGTVSWHGTFCGMLGTAIGKEDMLK